MLLSHSGPGIKRMKNSYNCQSFLETPEGLRYAPAFQAIRWEYVINVYKTTERMMRDRVVPEAWLGKVFCQQWLRLLHTHELQTQYTRSSNIGHGHSSSTGATSDSANNASRIRVTLTGRESTLPIPAADALRVEEPGPRSDLPEDVFWATSERCGRRMHNGDTTCSWRWTGFHFGFDVVVKYKRRTFSIIRFTESHSTEGSISHAPHLRLMISLRVKPLTPTGHETTNSPDDLDTLVDVVNEPVEKSGDQDSESCITSGVLRLSLEENVLIDVLRLPDHFVFPAVVAANILRYDPIGWIPITNTAFREDA
ncbi:unnamed protein product [Dicrocoelium dendriticum]|nr:unnamed protein product [Dicrocoelium dendriticum]